MLHDEVKLEALSTFPATSGISLRLSGKIIAYRRLVMAEEEGVGGSMASMHPLWCIWCKQESSRKANYHQQLDEATR